MVTKEYLIEILKENKVFEEGDFTLASGKKSNYYVNMKRAITEPEILSTIAKLINEEIDDDIDKIAGPALGAVKLIEGNLIEGDNVILVEDVTTTGGSLLKAINAILDNGGVVKKAFVVVDREEGAMETFANEGITLEPLISVSEFFE